MSTIKVDLYSRDRTCPKCKVFKTTNCFNKKSIHCKECSKIYYLQNKEKRILANKKYREENKDKRSEYRKKYFAKYYPLNREKYIQKATEWYNKNKKYLAAHFKQRLKTEPELLIAQRGRIRIRNLIKAGKAKRHCSFAELLGCSISHARRHIESLWEPGMTWENNTKTGWHIDHIIPCTAFNLLDVNEQKKCFHYTNLRPLWAKANISKSDILPDGRRARHL